MADWNWLDYALCKDADVDFFSDDPKEIERAKAICFDCPVRRECLQSALDNEDRFGVWGGADENQIRRALQIDQYGKPLSKPKEISCPYCGSTEIECVEMMRTKQHIRCADCDLTWWARVPSSIVKINEEDLEE